MALLEVSPHCTGMASFLDEIEKRLHETLSTSLKSPHPSSPNEMLEAEGRRRTAGLEMADLLIARDIVRAHLDETLVLEAVAERKKRYREDGHIGGIKTDMRWATVQLSAGLQLRVWTEYMRPTRKGLVGRPRGCGKRREGGAGAYPVLERLGIADRVTPLTRSDISRLTVLCSSYEEAREQLQQGGLDVDISTLVRVAVATGVKALALRDLALEQARELPLPEKSLVEGQRIRVSVDGGRARTRQKRKHARKGKNGRRPFTLEWKEPRVVTVDVLDDDGEMDRTWRPIYEVSLGKADEVFALLTGLLRLLGANMAAQVVFVSDGAEWIWNRVAQLMEDAEIPPDRVRLVLDYYHATEHVWEALQACKGIKAKQRKALFEELRRLLLKPDGPGQVVARLRTLARGRRGRKVNKEIRYLEGHLDHMRYAELRAEKVPIGSGVVESAVRRVLNLRFKAASMCWRQDHLAPLLYLRAIMKAGRWDDFMRAQLAGRHWLSPNTSAIPSDDYVMQEAA
jgi:hypothetical protein